MTLPGCGVVEGNPSPAIAELDCRLATYLINLDCSQDRLKRVSDVLRQSEIPFQRVAAVDGRRREARQFPQYNHRKALNRYGRPMSGAEVGCFLSHRQCLDAFLCSTKQYALVLEDDISLPNNFRQLLIQAIAVADCCMERKWDVINLGNPPEKYSHLIERLSTDVDGPCIHRCYYFPLGTFGLIWSRSGAERFIEKSRVVYEPIDQFLRDWCVRDGVGCALSPAPVIVDRSHSYIRPNWTDRLKINLLRYWAVKNWRLATNHYLARKLWNATGNCIDRDATMRPEHSKQSQFRPAALQSRNADVSSFRNASADLKKSA